MPKAIWNSVVLAESDKIIIVEGNHYFPPESINRQYFRPSETHTVCPWKGVASYYDLVVDGQVNRKRGLVLSRNQASGPEHQGLYGLLEGGQSRIKPGKSTTWPIRMVLEIVE
jgi:hypothetical protein